MSSTVKVPSDGDWMDALPPYQRRIVSTMLIGTDPLQAADTWLQASGPKDTAPFGAGAGRVNIFLLNLMREMYKLICTNDGYATDREQLVSAATAGKSTFVAAIATALAPSLGAAAVVISPAIVLVLSVCYNAAVSSGCQALYSRISELEAAGDH